jgi:hypothetical protein
MSVTIGVIAEDKSDVDVIRAIVAKISKSKVKMLHAVGHGSGRIPAKCRAWSENLRGRGCRFIILVHDLDEREVGELTRKIKKALGPIPDQSHVVVIPVREIEAWLLADHEAIRRVFRIGEKIRAIPNPEAIPRPKETLRDLIYHKSRGRIIYVNTVHNAKIASECGIRAMERCPSFLPLASFVRQQLGPKEARRRR